MFSGFFQKLAWICCGITIMAATLIPSCKSVPEIAAKAPTEQIKDVQTDVNTSNTELKKTTSDIKTNANNGLQKTPDNAKPSLQPLWINILNSVSRQEQLEKQLDDTSAKLDTAVKTSEKFETDFNNSEKRRKEAEDSSTQKLKEQYRIYSGILFFISLACGGLAIFSGGSKFALYGSILAGVGSAVCIFIVQTVALIPWIVGGLAIVLIGLGVYTFIHNRNLLKTQKVATDQANNKLTSLHKSFDEVVETLEAVKPKLTLGGRRAIFGDGSGKGEAFSIQSRETESLVKESRAKIEKAPPVQATIAIDVNGDGVIDEKDAVLHSEKTTVRKYILK